MPNSTSENYDDINDAEQSAEPVDESPSNFEQGNAIESLSRSPLEFQTPTSPEKFIQTSRNTELDWQTAAIKDHLEDRRQMRWIQKYETIQKSIFGVLFFVLATVLIYEGEIYSSLILLTIVAASMLKLSPDFLLNLLEFTSRLPERIGKYSKSISPNRQQDKD